MKFKFLLLSFLISVYGNAQNNTKYRQAEDAILIKYGKEIGITEQSLKDLLQKGDSNSAQQLFLKKFKTLPQYQIIEIGNRMAKDKEGINDLRLEEDFKQLATVGYNESDFFQIANTVSTKYDKWKLKGEFEKTEDYQKRVQDENNFIKNEIFEVINKIINSSTDKNKIKVIPLDYDADGEILNYRFSLREELIIWKGFIEVTPEVAKQLKTGSGKLITSMSVKDMEEKIQFSYFNIIPKNLLYINLDGKNYPIILTTIPYGLSNGEKLFTKENLKIQSTKFNGYSLKDYSSTSKQSLELTPIKQQIGKLSVNNYDTAKAIEIRNEIAKLNINETNSNLIKELTENINKIENQAYSNYIEKGNTALKNAEHFASFAKETGYTKTDLFQSYLKKYNESVKAFTEALKIKNDLQLKSKLDQIISNNKEFLKKLNINLN